MSPEPKTKAKKTKRRDPSEAVAKVEVNANVTDSDDTPTVPQASKSKCKARPKSRPKSATKQKSLVKRPKSRQSIAKEKRQAKATESDATQEFRDQVMAVLEALQNPSGNSNSKTKTNKTRQRAKERSSSSDALASSSKAKTLDRGKSKAIKEVEAKSKGKNKSRPKSRGGLACKSSKCNTRKVAKVQAEKSSAQVANACAPTTNTTQIFILGSPNDAKAVELLQSLMLKINSQSKEASQEQLPQPIKEIAKEPLSESPATEQFVTEQSELEELYDASYELGNNVRTIHDSYEKIIASLMNLQCRRKGTKEKMTLIPPSAAKTQTAPTTTATVSTNETSPGSIDRFMNPATRNEAFTELFGQVDSLKEEMASFLACFDDGGYFNQDLYSQRRITISQRDSWLNQIRTLAPIVDALLAEYNKEVLDMFRLSAVESSLGNE